MGRVTTQKLPPLMCFATRCKSAFAALNEFDCFPDFSCFLSSLFFFFLFFEKKTFCSSFPGCLLQNTVCQTSPVDRSFRGEKNGFEANPPRTEE